MKPLAWEPRKLGSRPTEREQVCRLVCQCSGIVFSMAVCVCVCVCVCVRACARARTYTW